MSKRKRSSQPTGITPLEATSTHPFPRGGDLRVAPGGVAVGQAGGVGGTRVAEERHLHQELSFPGAVIDRTSRARWLEEGAGTLLERAAAEVDRLLGEWEPSRLDRDTQGELERIMGAAARAAGMENLPDLGG